MEASYLNIQWYPGHMTKTRRMMEKDLKLVDVVAEIIDARIPISSRNPDIDDIVLDKPRIVVLNRSDQAQKDGNQKWAEYFKAQGITVMESDAKSGKGVNQFSQAVQFALKEKIAQWKEKGQVGKSVRVMIVGVPNVGKSTFINKISKRKSTKTQDRPGVTRGKQWVTVSQGLELLDTPGILWPKFEDDKIGMHLAFTGAVRDVVIDIETLAFHLMEKLRDINPKALEERYKIEVTADMDGWQLLEAAARKRGFLISGGEIDIERMANILLDEFRGGKLGRVTLEYPSDLKPKNSE